MDKKGLPSIIEPINEMTKEGKKMRIKKLEEMNKE
jgi:hypothetical protein